MHERTILIEAERIKLGLTKPKMAKAIGVTPQAYYHWLKTDTKPADVYLKFLNEVEKRVASGVA